VAVAAMLIVATAAPASALHEYMKHPEEKSVHRTEGRESAKSLLGATGATNLEGAGEQITGRGAAGPETSAYAWTCSPGVAEPSETERAAGRSVFWLLAR
jgi:hypothetical protein